MSMNYHKTLLVLFLLPFVVDSHECQERIRINRQQNPSSIYCSSCSTYVDGKISAPVLQLELPSLTKLTGIFIQNYNPIRRNQLTMDSYFIEYRRTQDGPWQAYGKRRQRNLFIERHRLFFNDNDSSNKTRTFLPSIIARQIRIIFVTSSVSICTVIKVYGCQSQNGLVSTRFPKGSIVNTDLKYDGWITNSTARGGLGMLTDGDTYQFVHWSSSREPILILFAFDSIKEFQTINLDLKCPLSLSTSCILKINVGILETVTSHHIWTNRFHSISIDNDQYRDNTTITHLILSVAKTKGQFVIIQINTKQGLSLSEITFNHRNEYDEQDLIPSSIYIETSLRRLESFALSSLSNETMLEHKLSYILVFILIMCILLSIFLLISCIFNDKKLHDLETESKETDQSFTVSTGNTSNDDNPEPPSRSDIYSNLQNHTLVSDRVLPISSQQIVTETSKATIRLLNSRRRSTTPRCSVYTFHSVYDHLSPIDSDKIRIIENLGVQSNHQCFYSEYGQNKVPVILYEEEHNEFFNLSKIINHKNIVSCLGYINRSPERCFLVSEYSRVNLYEHCKTLKMEDENTVTILMNFLHDVVSALIHFESLNIVLRDLTLPNCLYFDNKVVKISDCAKHDDRYVSRYVEQLPMRWLPGDIVTGDENWSVQTNAFMFGTLVFELFHLGSVIPYNDLQDNEVLRFFRDLWPTSKQNSVEPSVVCLSTYFPRPTLCHDRLYALVERCLSWSSSDRPSFREISLCLDETTTVLSQ